MEKLISHRVLHGDKVWERMVRMGYKAVRTDKYKFIHYVDLKGMDELYDLENDPYKLTNIIDASESVTVLAEMRKLMNKHLIETGGPTFPDWD